MGKNRQLAVNMAAQITASGINILISFILTPFIVKNVGEASYGFVELANNFISYATIITTALNSMAGRYITICIHQDRYEDTSKYFTSVLVANAAMSSFLTVAAVFILMFLNRIVEVPDEILSDVVMLWGFLFANFLIGLVGNVFSVATFSKNRLELSSLRNVEAGAIKSVILIIAYVFFRPCVWYIGLATLISGLYSIAANIRYTKKLLPFVKIKREYIDVGKARELILSGMWNSFSKLSSTLSNGLDLMITNLFVGASAMGVVSISKTMPGYILAMFGMLASVFMPQLTISYAKDDLKDMSRQLMTSIKLLGFFASIPVAVLWMYGGEFYRLWVPGQDAELLRVLSIVGTAAFPFVLSLEPLWNIFTVTNKVKQSSVYLMINSVISVALVFILLQFATDDVTKMYIVVGTSTALSIIRGLTFMPIYGAKCLNYKWYTFYPLIIKNCVALALILAISYGIKKVMPADSWLMLVVNCAVVALIACVINFVLILGKQDRAALKAIFARRRHKQ